MKIFEVIYRDTGEVIRIEADRFTFEGSTWVVFYVGHDEQGMPVAFRALRAVNLNEVREA